MRGGARDKAVRILIASFTFPPEASGVSEIARSQALGLRDRGHDVTVATAPSPGRDSKSMFAKITVREFKIHGSFELGVGYHGETSSYQKFITGGNFDIILCNCWQNWATDVALPAFHHTRAKKIMVSQGFNAHMRPRPGRFPWGWGAWLRRQPYTLRLPKMLCSFDHLIFLSARRDRGRFLDHAVAKLVTPSRISIIPNGVHVDDLRNARTDFRKVFGVSTRHLVLNVANYCDRKNQIDTLRDFVRANRADTTLVFIGSEFNDYSAELKQVYGSSCKQYAEARVIFLEKIPKEMINAAYRATDLFILSAKEETQPLAILDAMALGVPFISTDTGCVSEFPGGIVLPVGEETTRAVNRLLDDPDFRKRLGEQGRAACETQYDWERVLDAYEKMFAEPTA